MKTGNQYYIGWDVGGWHCPKNSSTKSQDAIFILNANLEPVGAARAGNIIDVILQSESTGDFIGGLFEYCSAPRRNESMVTLAIDAPLGFPKDFLNLAAKLRVVGAIENFRENRYLFRQTERHLADQGWKPMSAVQDSIGSQASKGMHVIARFAPRIVECGVWSGGKGRLTAIETYPTPCRRSALVLERLDGHLYGDSDRDDAEVCAIIASIFATDRGRLQCPGPEVPEREGWIWILR